MKTINSKLSYKLAPYLKNIDTEYIICDVWDWPESPSLSINLDSSFTEWASYEKTLTLEEALEFLPKRQWDFLLRIEPNYECDKWSVSYSYCEPCEFSVMFDRKTLLEAIETMLEYLLDNWLINNDNLQIHKI